MKRADLLKKLDFTVAESKKKRVIISSDINNEADDHFAVMHHLLTPSTDVRGIVASHYEWTPRMFEEKAKDPVMADMLQDDFVKQLFALRGNTVNLSYEVGDKLLKLANIDDVSLFRGSNYEIQDLNNLPQSEGVDFIIEEAMREDDRPLYIAILGSITDLAVAYLKEPKIAEKLTAIWIGGGEYPVGEGEFNLIQDVTA
ncbi:MAG: nucleoside hydrolase, partial [Lactovum sp.]